MSLKNSLIVALVALSCVGVEQCPGEGVVVSKVLTLSGGRGRCEGHVGFEYTVGSEAAEAEELFVDLEDRGFECDLVESGEDCEPFVTLSCSGLGTEVQMDWDYAEHTVNWSVVGGGLHTECWYE